jgi:hypothetical protein
MPPGIARLLLKVSTDRLVKLFLYNCALFGVHPTDAPELLDTKSAICNKLGGQGERCAPDVLDPWMK